MEWHTIVAIAIFLLVFILIATEKFNKTVLALAGAVIFLLLKVVRGQEIFQIIDWEVILLLVSMMVMVSVLQRTGLFQWAAIRLAKALGGNPVAILMGVFILNGVFSSFLDNVTTVLLLIPISILIAVELGVNPAPFVIIQAIGSNIGGTATLIGDPPNIMIGVAAELSFTDFLFNLAPGVLAILAASCLVIFAIFSGRMAVTNERKARIMDMDEGKAITDLGFLLRSLVILVAVIAGFVLHTFIDLPIFIIAMAGATVMLVFEPREDVHRRLQDIEWETIFFFIGLFIMIGGLEKLGVINFFASWVIQLTGGNLLITSTVILWASGLISGLVDNIPYVATMIPMVLDIQAGMPDPATAIPVWWSLALGACLGGNLTLVGASANVVSVALAKKNGIKITFLHFSKYGLLFGFLSLVVAMVYLLLVIYPRYTH